MTSSPLPQARRSSERASVDMQYTSSTCPRPSWLRKGAANTRSSFVAVSSRVYLRASSNQCCAGSRLHGWRWRPAGGFRSVTLSTSQAVQRDLPLRLSTTPSSTSSRCNGRLPAASLSAAIATFTSTTLATRSGSCQRNATAPTSGISSETLLLSMPATISLSPCLPILPSTLSITCGESVDDARLRLLLPPETRGARRQEPALLKMGCGLWRFRLLPCCRCIPLQGSLRHRPEKFKAAHLGGSFPSTPHRCQGAEDPRGFYGRHALYLRMLRRRIWGKYITARRPPCQRLGAEGKTMPNTATSCSVDPDSRTSCLSY